MDLLLQQKCIFSITSFNAIRSYEKGKEINIYFRRVEIFIYLNSKWILKPVSTDSRVLVPSQPAGQYTYFLLYESCNKFLVLVFFSFPFYMVWAILNLSEPRLHFRSHV